MILEPDGAPDWAAAECRRRGIATFRFYFEEYFHQNSREYQEARQECLAVCAACPIRQACADYAIETNQEGGMWGGMTLTQRRWERRRRYQVAQKELQEWLAHEHA